MVIHFRRLYMVVSKQDIYQITVPTPFPVGDVHMYLLTGDVLTLIDTGVKTKEAWEALNDQLKSIGYSVHDIEQVVLTHHHPDHIGLIDQLPKVQQIAAHAYIDPWLTRDQVFFEQYELFYEHFFKRCGVPDDVRDSLNGYRGMIRYIGTGEVTYELTDGDFLPGHAEWQVIDTKGHAQSHLSFFNKKHGTFIGGDHLLYHISPNPLLEPIDQVERAKPLLQYQANLRKCLSLGIKNVLPGHGPIFSNISSHITKQLNEQEERATVVYKMIQQKPRTPFEICQKLFPTQYRTQLVFTMSETVGQLDYLEADDKVKVREENGVLVYHIKKGLGQSKF